MIPDPAEVRERTTCTRCPHARANHAEPIVHDGHCTTASCDCVGFDPMTDDEWRAVMAVERGQVRCGTCGETWPCPGWIRGGVDAWQHAAVGAAR